MHYIVRIRAQEDVKFQHITQTDPARKPMVFFRSRVQYHAKKNERGAHNAQPVAHPSRCLKRVVPFVVEALLERSLVEGGTVEGQIGGSDNNCH